MKPGNIGNDWTAKITRVSSAMANVSPEAEVVDLTVVLAYGGSGESLDPVAIGRTYVGGAHHSPISRLPAQAATTSARKYNAGSVKLFSCGHQSNHMCFEVASNDVSRLALHFGAATTPKGTKLPAVTFALRYRASTG